MSILTVAITAAFLALPAAAPAQACGAGLHSAKAAVADYSAAKKKKKTKKLYIAIMLEIPKWVEVMSCDIKVKKKIQYQVSE